MKMNRKATVLAFVFLFGAASFSLGQNPANSLQNAVNSATVTKDPKDTTKMTWKTGGLYNLTFSQAALSNWSAGGDKSALSLNTLLNVYAFYANGRNSWDNMLVLAYGVTNTTSLGTRKTNDNIDLTSKYGYDVGKKWYLTGLL